MLAVCQTQRKLQEFTLWTWEVCGVSVLLQTYLCKTSASAVCRSLSPFTKTTGTGLKFLAYLEHVRAARNHNADISLWIDVGYVASASAARLCPCCLPAPDPAV